MGTQIGVYNMIGTDEWRCNWDGFCKREPYVEAYVVRIGDEETSWSYLCRFHYIIDRIIDILRKRKRGYYILTDEEIKNRCWEED